MLMIASSKTRILHLLVFPLSEDQVARARQSQRGCLSPMDQTEGSEISGFNMKAAESGICVVSGYVVGWCDSPPPQRLIHWRVDRGLMASLRDAPCHHHHLTATVSRGNPVLGA